MSEHTILGYITTFDSDRDEQPCDDIHRAIHCGLASVGRFSVWQLTQPSDGPRQQRCVLLFDPQGVQGGER